MLNLHNFFCVSFGDTHNTIDFTSSLKRALCGIDGVILILSSTNGVPSQSIKVNNFKKALELPTFFITDKFHEREKILLGQIVYSSNSHIR